MDGSVGGSMSARGMGVGSMEGEGRDVFGECTV